MSMHLACEQGMMGPTAYDVARPGYRAAGPVTGPPALGPGRRPWHRQCHWLMGPLRQWAHEDSGPIGRAQRDCARLQTVTVRPSNGLGLLASGS
jgi:hypothetical protein